MSVEDSGTQCCGKAQAERRGAYESQPWPPALGMTLDMCSCARKDAPLDERRGEHVLSGLGTLGGNRLVFLRHGRLSRAC